MFENEKKKINFSVVIITLNEELNIKDCIESFYEIADEVVVLDSHSTDSTIKIAGTYPKVKIFSRDFNGHIEQKDKAIELANGNWILSLDADERVSETLRKEISSILSIENNPVDGYKIPRLTYHLGKFIKHGGWYPLKRYRLFKKGSGIWTGENPHDYINLEGNGSVLRGDIIHYSFKDLSHQVETINKFSSIVGYTRFKKKVKFPIIKSLYKPIIKFLETYIFKLGFLDGYAGLIIAISSSYSTFLKFAKLYELEKGLIERPSNLRKEYGKK